MLFGSAGLSGGLKHRKVLEFAKHGFPKRGAERGQLAFRLLSLDLFTVSHVGAGPRTSNRVHGRGRRRRRRPQCLWQVQVRMRE